MSMLVAIMAAALAGAAETPREITTAGPKGTLAGTLVPGRTGGPVVLIIPGSGPTDRDGNNPLGVTAGSYRLLAEALAARGVTSVRIDKRGMFGSKAAVADANAVTIDQYAGDVQGWVTTVRGATGAKCVWLIGHSEGGLIALKAAQQPAGLCGVVLIASPGVPLGQTIRAQLRANPGNAPVFAQVETALVSLEAGKTVDVAAMHPAVQQLFAPKVQSYMIDLLAQNPVALAAKVRLPMLIVAGSTDLQIAAGDAAALAKAQPSARLVVVPGMNHVLKTAPAERKANLATYADPSLKLAPGLVEPIVRFVSGLAPVPGPGSAKGRAAGRGTPARP
jgi:uncharacterized protein